MRAHEHLEAAIRIDPDFAGALNLMVSVQEHFGDTGKINAARARAGMREFSDVPDPWLSDLMMDCYDPYRVSVVSAVAYAAGNAAGARRLLERAVLLAPAMGTYSRQLGKLHIRLSNNELARHYLEQAVELDPKDTEAWDLLIELLNQTGDVAAMDRAITADLRTILIEYQRQFGHEP